MPGVKCMRIVHALRHHPYLVEGPAWPMEVQCYPCSLGNEGGISVEY